MRVALRAGRSLLPLLAGDHRRRTLSDEARLPWRANIGEHLYGNEKPMWLVVKLDIWTKVGVYAG